MKTTTITVEQLQRWGLVAQAAAESITDGRPIAADAMWHLAEALFRASAESDGEVD